MATGSTTNLTPADQLASRVTLSDAARRRLECTLAFAQTDCGPIVLRSRFSDWGEADSTIGSDLPLECPVEHLAHLHGRVSLEAPVTAHFRSGADDVFFCSRLKRFEPGPTPRAICLRLAMPSELVATQRRKTFRIEITPEDAIAARLWRIDDHVLIRDRPKPSQELACALRDLGTGGLRALVRAPRLKALALVENQRFRIELSVAGTTPMLFEGRLRHPRQTNRDDEEAVCGIRFVHRDNDIEGRRNLQKLQVVLGHVQRQAAARRDAAA